jgi:hypothetical protein
MRNTSRVLAVIVFLAAVGFWAAKGANLGWTINNLAHETVDVSTGLTGVFYEKAFIPGLDFLAVAALIAVVLGGVSFLFGKRKAGT